MIDLVDCVRVHREKSKGCCNNTGLFFLVQNSFVQCVCMCVYACVSTK